MSRRYAANNDKNQTDIVADLRDLGFSVETGHDDILVGYEGLTRWYEVKSDRAVSKKTGKVYEHEKKKSQIRLENEFKGHYKIVSSLAEILEDMNFSNIAIALTEGIKK
jgi:hypothetical protein